VERGFPWCAEKWSEGAIINNKFALVEKGNHTTDGRKWGGGYRDKE